MSTLTGSSPISQSLIPDGTIGWGETKNGKCTFTWQAETPVTYWISFPAKFNFDRTGLFPFVIQNLFLDLAEVVSDKEDKALKPFRASIFKGISAGAPSENEYIDEMIKTKQLAAFHFVSGILKGAWVHEDWVAKMENNAVSEIAFDNGAAYSHIKEDFDLTPLDNVGYFKLLTKLGLKV